MAEKPTGKLRACGLICEYNPFHYGHAYQIAELKKQYDAVVCILGGNLTQRGQVAVADKYARAEAALRGGADLVVELPIPWCVSSAEEFALGGTAIAEGLEVNALAFSAESDEAVLRAALANREANAAELSRLTREEHLPYPKAVERVCGISLSDHPNDILGLCYLSHLTHTPAHVIRRDPSYLSSRAIRSSETPEKLLPAPSVGLLPFREDGAVYPFLRAAFQNAPEKEVYGMTDELFSALLAAVQTEETFDALIGRTVSRQFTASRVRRALWASVLKIPRALPHEKPKSSLLLAANETGRRFLSEHRKTRALSVYSRPAECRDDPAYALSLRADRVLRVFFGGDDPMEQKPFLSPDVRKAP